LSRQIKYRSSDVRAEINPDMEVSGWGMPRDERAGKIKNRLTGRDGQSIMEYALIVAVVVAALAAMSIYVQRSAQANLKVIEDQINTQPLNY